MLLCLSGAPILVANLFFFGTYSYTIKMMTTTTPKAGDGKSLFDEVQWGKLEERIAGLPSHPVKDSAPPQGGVGPRGKQPKPLDAVAKLAYPKQRDIAKQLLEKIDTASKNGGGSLETFENFAFFLQVPSMNSLYNQTVDRLEEFFRSYAIHARKLRQSGDSSMRHSKA